MHEKVNEGQEYDGKIFNFSLLTANYKSRGQNDKKMNPYILSSFHLILDKQLLFLAMSGSWFFPV